MTDREAFNLVTAAAAHVPDIWKDYPWTLRTMKRGFVSWQDLVAELENVPAWATALMIARLEGK